MLHTDAGVRDGPGETAEQPVVQHGMMLAINHFRGDDSYAYPDGGVSGSFRTPARDDLATGDEGQGKLFGSHHTPGRSKVDVLVSTKSARIHAPMMLALAQQDTEQLYPGRQLQASADRSRFSDQLVSHLESKLGTQFSKRVNRNHIKFTPEGKSIRPREQMEEHPNAVPEHEVERARQTARSWVRAPKQGPKHPGFEVHQLPGMEGL